MNIQETVDFQIRSTLFAMRRMYTVLAAEVGLTQGVGYVLINVPKEGVAATRIAPMMGMGPTSLSRLLKNMETDGLIYRKADEKDRRVVFIHLTENGMALRKKARQVVLDFNNKLFSQISEAEMQTFVSVSERIRSQISIEMSRFQDTKIEEIYI